jgi:hypothetical protein
MKLPTFLATTIVVAVAAGCGSESSTFGEQGGSGPGQQPPGSFENETPPSTAATTCSDGAKLVYVINRTSDLYSFAPDKLTFTKIGRLNCPSGLPNSMAIDRTGTAWVNFKDGKLGKVSTVDATCTETNFAPSQQGFAKFGMAFSSLTTTADTLFVAGVGQDTVTGGKGLGTIDLSSLSLAMIGDYSGDLAKRAAELTGTGDGRLYGFFFTTPSATLAQIDPAKGTTSNPRILDGVNVGQAFAFSFWGGDFWFYTSEGIPPNDKPSKVTRLNTQTNELSVVLPDVGGFSIVGAGASTCAPTTQPK